MELYTHLFQCSKELGNEYVSCAIFAWGVINFHYKMTLRVPPASPKLSHTLPKLGTLEQTRLSY